MFATKPACFHKGRSTSFPLKFLLLSTLLLSANATRSEERLPLRPFAVADAIEATRLIDPEVEVSPYWETEFNVSSDGNFLAIVTRQGDLKSNRNFYTLILFETAAILDFVNEDRHSKPLGKILVRFSSASNTDAIRAVRWLSDNKTLAFIGESADELGQVYTVDIGSGETRKLTSHPRSVASFDLSADARTLAYTSTVPRHHEGRDSPSFVVGVKNFEEVMHPDHEVQFPPHYQYYALRLNGADAPLPLGRSFAGARPPDIWLSPDGRWAVGSITAENAPSEWGENYRPFKENFLFAGVTREFDKDTMKPSNRFSQFAFIDIVKASVEPIFDAPGGNWLGGLSLASWLPDGQRVVLANTFLPLDVSDKRELARRREAPAIVEFDVLRKKITWITGLAETMRDGLQWGKWRFAGMDLASDGTLTIRRRSSQGALPPKIFRKRRNDEWTEVTNELTAEKPAHGRLILSVRQDLNTPPDILARDARTGRERIITDWNPQFRRLALGKAEVFEWMDKSGATWQAGLIYPPGFRAGERYPLVIQTHGFNRNEFLIDGPDGTTAPYAARALANKGMLVLQVGDRLDVGARREELEAYRVGIEAAIDELDKRHLIERQRVGLIGWSGTGVIVQHLITFSTYDFAAATIADAYNISLAGYSFFYGLSAPGMLEIERMVGAVPWGDKLMTWVERNPVMHLDQVNAALRIERYVPGLVQWWDTYTILRRLHKPVEFVVFPNAAHIPVKPLQRLSSQQGNVDWFAFWLKGEEDPDPAKASQYERWRQLRRQLEKESPGAPIR